MHVLDGGKPGDLVTIIINWSSGMKSDTLQQGSVRSGPPCKLFSVMVGRHPPLPPVNNVPTSARATPQHFLGPPPLTPAPSLFLACPLLLQLQLLLQGV